MGVTPVIGEVWTYREKNGSPIPTKREVKVGVTMYTEWRKPERGQEFKTCWRSQVDRGTQNPWSGKDASGQSVEWSWARAGRGRKLPSHQGNDRRWA